MHTDRLSDGNPTNAVEQSEESVFSQKKVRSNPNIKPEEAGVARNVKALSPSSANIRPPPRATPSAKAISARPLPLPEEVPGRSKSPVKQMSATNLFSNWADKARSTRTNATEKRGNPSVPAKTNSATGTVKEKKPATTATTKTAATTKTQRRVSGTSESSESSTSTMSKKSITKQHAASTDKAASKRAGVMGSIRRGVAGAAATKKAAAAKAAPASTATGRVLRKRNN